MSILKPHITQDTFFLTYPFCSSTTITWLNPRNWCIIFISCKANPTVSFIVFFRLNGSTFYYNFFCLWRVLCIFICHLKNAKAQNLNICKRDLPPGTTQRNITYHFLIWCSSTLTCNRLQNANYTLRNTNAYNNSVTWRSTINVKHTWISWPSLRHLSIWISYINLQKKDTSLHITRSLNYNINKITFSHAINSTTHAFLHNFVTVLLTNT